MLASKHKRIVFLQMVSMFALGIAFFSPANADDESNVPCCRGDGSAKRWYFGLGLGLGTLNDSAAVPTNPAFATSVGSYDLGFGVSGAIGYRVFSGVRMEFEATERSNTTNKQTNAVADSGNAGKFPDIRSTALMVNSYLDLHNDSPYTPYIGAGIGEVLIKYPLYYFDIATNEKTKSFQGWTTGEQFMLGITYEFKASETPFDVSLGYRYFTTQDVSEAVKLTNLPGKVRFSNTSQNIELGGRMYF